MICCRHLSISIYSSRKIKIIHKKIFHTCPTVFELSFTIRTMVLYNFSYIKSKLVDIGGKYGHLMILREIENPLLPIFPLLTFSFSFFFIKVKLHICCVDHSLPGLPSTPMFYCKTNIQHTSYERLRQVGFATICPGSSDPFYIVTYNIK